MIHIVLLRPESAANTGNIMRTAAAVGARLHVIGPFPFPLFGKEVMKAALDYGSMLEVIEYLNLDDFMVKHHDPSIFMVTRYGRYVYTDIDYAKIDPLYVMFGSESSGIPLDVLREHKDKTIRIPMRPAARSLNLANCVALVTYEIMRQKKFAHMALMEVLKGDDYL